MSYNLPHRTPHSTKSSYQSVEVLLSLFKKIAATAVVNAVDAISPSSSESSLVSPMQTSIHDSDLSSNSKSKAKRGRKAVINEKQWRSDEIMQLISMWEQKEDLYNAASPDYSIREKRSKAIKEIAEKPKTTEEAVSRKMASLKSYYRLLKQSYKAAKTKSGSGTVDDNVNPRDTICNISTKVPSPESVPKKRSKKGSQESNLVSQEEAWFSNQNILKAKFLQSCNESQEGKREDDLFGQIVAKFLRKISNWEINEGAKLEIQKLLFQAK